MPLRWLQDGLCARGRHAGHPFWYVRATAHHSDALLHKADWAASQDTVLQNTPPDPGHAQLIVACHDSHLDLRPPTMRTLGEVAQRAQTDHALTHRGHTPLGAAHATAYVHAGDLTATATNCRALRARDCHTPVQRRLRVRRERLSGVAVLPQPCLLCGGGDPGAHARGVRPLTASLAPLPPGGTRGGPPPPTREQNPVGGLVALRRCHMDGSLLLRAGARGCGAAASRHSPLRPARRNLCGEFPPPHAPAGGLRIGASQPPAGATPPRAPKRGSLDAPMAHRGGGLPPPPSPAP